MTTQKVCVISDTHQKHNHLQLAPCDILIHCGDSSLAGDFQEFVSFGTWFEKQDAKHRIYVPGNHDWYCREDGYYLVKDILKSTHVLIKDYIEIKNLKIFGSSYYSNGFLQCPEDIDILITHEPPQCILDEVPPHSRFNSDQHPEYIGNLSLFNEVTKRINPKYHLFGHVHECGGQIEKHKDTTFVNAAVMDEYYKVVRPSGITFNI